MTTRIYRTITTLGFILVAAVCSAQDFHLSQYEANPLYLNPALTGFRVNEDWDYRINANYREQWKMFRGMPFTTFASGFDAPLNRKFSVGELVMDNKSGGTSFNTLNVLASGSYKITSKDADNHHNLSVGLQLGFLQKSFNPESIVYDSQYSPSDPEVFDKNLPSGETYKYASIFGFDANMGIYYRYMDKEKKSSPFAGFSIYHLTRPDESFTGQESKLPMRFTVHAGWYYKLTEKFTILREVLYLYQAKANELNLGLQVFYKIQTGFEPMLGLSWRNKDAFVFHLGLKHNNNIIRVSYDVSTSYLGQYNNGRGGLEFSIIYTGKKKNTAQQLPANSSPPAETIKGEL